MDQQNGQGMGMRGLWTHPWARKSAIAALVFLAAFLAVITVRELLELRYIGAGIVPTNTITVEGKGEAFAIPDIAEFSFSVTELGATTAAAQEKAAGKINRAIGYLKSNGVAEKDIKTTGYNAYPKYEWQQVSCITYPCPPGKNVLLGFEVSQTVLVKVRDTNKAGDLLTGVGAQGVKDISGLNFTVDDIESVKAEARAKAIADAKAKADILRKDLGVRIVRIVSFSEFGAEPPVLFGRGGAVEATDAKVAPEVPVGENKIVSQVSITYEIR